MQEFNSRIGSLRLGMIVSAVLLAAVGVLCLVNKEMMPEPMHNTGLPAGLTTGGILIAVALAVAGVVLLASFAKAGGFKSVSGFLFLQGAFILFCAIATITDPIFGTLSYEWVCAVFFGLLGVVLIIEGFCASRLIGYKGWWLQVLAGLVMVCLAVGVLLDSSMANIMAAGAFFVGAVEILAIPFMANGLQVKA